MTQGVVEFIEQSEALRIVGSPLCPCLRDGRRQFGIASAEQGPDHRVEFARRLFHLEFRRERLDLAPSISP